MSRFEYYVIKCLASSAQVRNVNFMKILVFKMNTYFLSLLNTLLGELSWILTANNFIFVLLSLPVAGNVKVDFYSFNRVVFHLLALP